MSEIEARRAASGRWLWPAALFVLGTAGLPELVQAAPSETSRWCAPELEVLPHDVCFSAPPRPPRDGVSTVVLFLHSLINRDTNWQWEQQRAIVRAAAQNGYAALTPRGRLGLGPGGATDVWAWPTAQRTEQAVGNELVAEWNEARRSAEQKHGAFQRLLVFGFSSGAYYGASLALHDRIPADGYALIAGGSGSRWKATQARSVTRRARVFVAYGTKDPARRDPLALARLLKELDWPHRLDVAKVGHTVTPEQLRRAFDYLSPRAASRK